MFNRHDLKALSRFVDNSRLDQATKGLIQGVRDLHLAIEYVIAERDLLAIASKAKARTWASGSDSKQPVSTGRPRATRTTVRRLADRGLLGHIGTGSRSCIN